MTGCGERDGAAKPECHRAILVLRRRRAGASSLGTATRHRQRGQFSRATSTRLTSGPCGLRPGFCASRSAALAKKSRFCFGLRPVLNVICSSTTSPVRLMRRPLGSQKSPSDGCPVKIWSGRAREPWPDAIPSPVARRYRAGSPARSEKRTRGKVGATVPAPAYRSESTRSARTRLTLQSRACAGSGSPKSG